MRPGRAQPTADILRSLSEAFNIMNYDVGLISRDEAKALRQSNVITQGWQQTANASPFTVIETANGDVGFLRLPSLPKGENMPSAELINRISRDVERYRPKVDLLVALADWGWSGELEFLMKNPQNVPDILLGSGRGAGINGRIMADDRCLWVRTYDKGRSIAEITILEWPDRENSFAWSEARNYKTLSKGLDDSIKDHPGVSAILH